MVDKKNKNEMLATNTLAGQRSIAPIVFSAQRSTSRVQTGLTVIQHGSNGLAALAYLATQMLLNTMTKCRLKAVAFQA